MRGTESDVAGMISATRSMKTVSESSTVMPWDSEERERERGHHEIIHNDVIMVTGVQNDSFTYLNVISYVLMTTTIGQLVAPLTCPRKVTDSHSELYSYVFISGYIYRDVFIHTNTH